MPMDTAIPMAARGFWLAGVTLEVLFACGHFAGFMMGRTAARTDPKLAEVTRLMREITTKVGPFRPSLLDFREYFSMNFSIFLVAVAALNLAAHLASSPSASTMRALCIVNISLMIALAATSVGYGVIQGLVSSVLIALLFGFAIWRL